MLAAACAGPRYTTRGSVVEIDVDGAHVTVDHDAVPGLMPAMRMRFAVRDPELLQGVRPGDEVRLTLGEAGGDLLITDLQAVGGPARPRPGVHDHTPHHGGVVTMVGLRHLEAVARPDGRLRVYVSDAWRRPLPVDAWRGQAVLDLAGGPHAMALLPDGDALAGSGPAFQAADVLVHLRLEPPGEPAALEANLTLALTADAAGVAVAPRVRCADGAEVAAGSVPRCTLAFGEPVTALAAAGRMEVALGIQNAGVSVWGLEAAVLARAFDAAPAVAAPVTGPPHAEIVDALAIAPDGRQALVASEGRLLRYAVASGRLLRVLDAPAPLVRGMRWLPGSESVVVHGAFGDRVWRVASGDGRVEAELVAGAPVTTVAVAAGDRLLLGTERGEVLAFDGRGGDRRLLATVARPVRGIEVTGGRVIVATGAGTLEILDPSGRRLGASAPASPCHRIALAAPAGVVACAAFDRHVRLYDATARLLADLAWHQSLVQDLAFAGTTLVTADAAGMVAVWDERRAMR